MGLRIGREPPKIVFHKTDLDDITLCPVCNREHTAKPGAIAVYVNGERLGILCPRCQACTPDELIEVSGRRVHQCMAQSNRALESAYLTRCVASVLLPGPADEFKLQIAVGKGRD